MRLAKMDRICRHCERSEAIHTAAKEEWIASLRSQRRSQRPRAWPCGKALTWRGSQRRSGDECLFRGAGFSPDADGRALLAPSQVAHLGRRHLRDQTRRRVLDVERLHGGRDRIGAARSGGAGARRSRRRRRRPRARLHRARGARKSAACDRWSWSTRWPRSSSGTSRACCRSASRFAPIRAAVSSMATSSRCRIPPAALTRSRPAAASTRCWSTSITRPAISCIRATPRCTSLRGLPGSLGICVPAACSRCGRTTRRMKYLKARFPSAFAISSAHVVAFDNAFGERDASNTVYVAVKADLPIRQANPGASPPPV